MNAIAGFLEISPKAYPTPNPFYFSIEAWDKHYNLSAGTGTTQRKSPNYTEYQEIHAYTGRTYVVKQPRDRFWARECYYY